MQNQYLAAITPRDAQKVTRWPVKIEAHNQQQAMDAAVRKLRPKSTQAVWVKFHSTNPSKT